MNQRQNNNMVRHSDDNRSLQLLFAANVSLSLNIPSRCEDGQAWY